MKEALLAMLLTMGPNADNEITIMQIILPQEINGNVIDQAVYLPSIRAKDNIVGAAKIIRPVKK